jgi:hypothetical protein
MERVVAVRMAAIGRSKVDIENDGKGVEVGMIPELDNEVTRDD